MNISAAGSGSKVDVSGEIAMKVLKDQLNMQKQLVENITQPTMVYDANGTARAVPPHPTFDIQM